MTYNKPLRLEVVPRSEWSARPPVSPDIPAMVHPVRQVFLAYSTSEESCLDRESCCRVLRDIQDGDMAEGAPDIAYNFLVGGDERVYEGRGWGRQPEYNAQYPGLASDVVAIAFIGDFTNETLPYNLAKVALELVAKGIREKYVKNSYRLKESHPKLNFDEE